MLGLFVLNNDAGNIVIFPIGSKYFWIFFKENPRKRVVFRYICVIFAG